MIESLLGWLTGAAPDGSRAPRDGLQLALAALLVEAADSDDHFDERERAVIKQMLERRFELSHDEARALLAAGEREAGRTAELFHLTRIINERLSFERRIESAVWRGSVFSGGWDSTRRREPPRRIEPAVEVQEKKSPP
jgi:uncharacterized tellurite resistance protein B-like protein